MFTKRQSKIKIAFLKILGALPTIINNKSTEKYKAFDSTLYY